MSHENPDTKTNDLWAKIGKTLKAGAETIVEGTKELTRAGKLRLELLALENERNKKHGDIGRKVHEMHKQGIVFPAELSPLFESVNDTEVRILAKKDEMEKARKEIESKEEPVETEGPTIGEETVGRFCTNCGAHVDEGHQYCSQCGHRLEQ